MVGMVGSEEFCRSCFWTWAPNQMWKNEEWCKSLAYEIYCEEVLILTWNRQVKLINSQSQFLDPNMQYIGCIDLYRLHLQQYKLPAPSCLDGAVSNFLQILNDPNTDPAICRSWFASSHPRLLTDWSSLISSSSSSSSSSSTPGWTGAS